MVAACFDIVKREVEDMTPEELDEMLLEMRRRQRAYMQQGLPAQEAGQKAAQTVGNDLKLAAAIERRNAAINLRIRTEALDFINTQFADNPAEGLTALLAGSNKAGRGTRMSADAVQTALKGEYIGGLVGDLERAGLFELFAHGEIDADVARALWAIKSPEEFAKFPKEAREIAKIVRRWQEKARIDANRAGAWIGEADGYIVRQSHDADKLQRVGFERWRDAILPRLDLSKMFPDGVPPRVELDRYLEESYTGIVSGIHETLATNAEKMAGFKGPGNIAKKLSQGRKLEFKSADDWFAYNQEFGTGNVREAVLMGLSRSADATGLMRVLGTNPEFNLQSIYDAVRGQLREARDFEGLRQLEKWGNPSNGWGRALLEEVIGRSSAPANRTLATAGTVIRGLNSMTALGGAVLSSVTDIPVRAMELRYQGQNFLGSIAEGVLLPITRLLEGSKSAAERKALLAELGYFSEGVSGLLGARFSAQDNVAGTMSKAQRLFFKASFLTGWTDIFRDASMLATSGHLAALANLDFAKLPEATIRLLDQYGIGAEQWQLLRSATRTLGDKTVLSPQAVRELPTARFAELAAERINTLKAGLAERIQRRMQQDERELEWVSKRSTKLREGLAAARKKLDERMAKLEGSASKELDTLSAKMSRLEERIDFAEGFWLQRVERSQTVGFYGKRKLRDAGIDEGKAREAAKQLRAEVRQIGRDVEKARKSLNKEFIDRWQARQEELVEFADRIEQRVQERAQRTAEEIGELEPRIERILEDTREDVAVRLQTLLSDRMNYAVVSPDARARAVTTWGQQRGTPAGEIARAVMQFKSFGVGFTQRVVGREVYGYGARRLRDIRSREIVGLANLIVTTTAFGYLAMAAKDLTKGKKPRDVNDWKTWAAAMQQGGGFGIYGDFLFGEASRAGGSPLETLSGPTLGKAVDMWDLVQSAKDGRDVGAKAFRVAVNNTPFVNLFYTRLALDYLVFWRIQESLNPGYLRRMERRAKSENAQEYWLRPMEAPR